MRLELIAVCEMCLLPSGSTFFQDWSFTNHADNTTSGDVQYANATVRLSLWFPEALCSLATQYAQANRLAYVNEQGQAIVAVDNTSFVPYNEKRLSVRMTSDYAFAVGSVFVLDATHMPYGCSVWPSFWSLGEDWCVLFRSFAGPIMLIFHAGRRTARSTLSKASTCSLAIRWRFMPAVRRRACCPIRMSSIDLVQVHFVRPSSDDRHGVWHSMRQFERYRHLRLYRGRKLAEQCASRCYSPRGRPTPRIVRCRLCRQWRWRLRCRAR